MDLERETSAARQQLGALWGRQRDHLSECLEPRDALIMRAKCFFERCKELLIEYGEICDAWDDPDYDYEAKVAGAHDKMQLRLDEMHQFFADQCLLPCEEYTFTHVEDRDWKKHSHAMLCVKCFRDVRGAASHWEGNCYWCADCRLARDAADAQ
ncbi:MAG: hypothetical protein KGR26_00110 [Cyanobacteria bacterium REEB65]|nr:hypothetical protein [Cyanobacteria bacterium REEB65]